MQEQLYTSAAVIAAERSAVDRRVAARRFHFSSTSIQPIAEMPAASVTTPIESRINPTTARSLIVPSPLWIQDL